MNTLFYENKNLKNNTMLIILEMHNAYYDKK